MYPIRPQDNPNLYTVDEIKKILRCGKNKAYEVVNSRGFPAIRLGKSIRIPKDKFHQWLTEQSETTNSQKEATA